VEFVESNRSGPYFLFLSLALPHTPLQAPEKWVSPFRRRMPDARALYAGMLRCLDDGVGQVRAALERTGQWSRTVVIFASDHGWVKKRTPAVAGAGRNEPFRGGKYELLEGGIRVPCIVYWPGLTKKGTVCAEPSWLADWFPTITGKRTPDSQDLRLLLAGKPAPGKRDLCWRFADALVQTPLSQAIRHGDWKLLDVGSERSLFDLSRDPAEKQNLSDRYPDVVPDLERRLAVWTRQVQAQ
jgi:arylsulfatase A